MKVITLLLIVLTFSCKNEKKEIELKNTSQTTSLYQKDTLINTTVNNVIKKQDTTVYKKIKIKCDKKEFPSYCSYQNSLKISFLFEDEPNKIVIKNVSNTISHEIPFFEGLDYIPHLLERNNSKVLIVELFFEYGRKYIVFRISKNEINFIKDFYIDDLTNDKGKFVEHVLSIIESNKDIILQIGKEPFTHKELLIEKTSKEDKNSQK